MNALIILKYTILYIDYVVGFLGWQRVISFSDLLDPFSERTFCVSFVPPCKRAANKKTLPRMGWGAHLPFFKPEALRTDALS